MLFLNVMDTETQKIIETVRAVGVCLVHGLLTDEELEEARSDLTRAYEESGKGETVPGERSRLSGPSLLKYPGLARVYGHPRIIELSSLITEEPKPFLQEIVANRYIPPHPGVSPHLDEDFGELIPPLMRVTWACFLDDISSESGALTYAPGTHWRNYIDPDDSEKITPSKEEVQQAEYIPISLKAGTLILRAADVWHGVRPIHHLRRYITGSYSSRSRTSQWLEANMAGQLEERGKIPEEEIPAGISPHFY
jgi:hypothetical protein